MKISIILKDEEKNCPEYVPTRETHNAKQKKNKGEERKTFMYVYVVSKLLFLSKLNFHNFFHRSYYFDKNVFIDVITSKKSIIEVI